MVEYITEKDVKQTEYLERLELVHSFYLPNYNLKDILFNETYNCQQYSFMQVLSLLVRVILLRIISLDCKINGSDVLTIYTKNYRKDHDTYWKKILDHVGKHDEITILKSSGSRLDKVDFKGIPSKIKLFYAFNKELSGINSIKDRCYLAVCLLLRKQTLDEITKMELNPKIVMCYFDSSPDENILIPYFRGKGAITITNQHGQTIFRSKDFDRVNQSQILNFKSDYYLAKGEMQREQFLAAGEDNAKIIVLGTYDVWEEPKYNKVSKKIFGVFLDCPGFEFSKSANLELIRMAESFASEMNYHYFVKIHPADTADKYKKMVSSKCIDVYDKSYSLLETFKNMEFAIIHATATYIDVYLYGLRCLKLKTEAYFPISYKEDDFCSVKELVEKVHKWEQMNKEEQANYICKVREKYLTKADEDSLRNFIDSLLKN